MDTLFNIPTLDPSPLPAPYWIFKLLLIVTFGLHIIAMNFMLGGGFWALVARSRSKKAANYQRLFHDVSQKIPVLLPATITLGVAPLLFLQVIYGQFFYTSTIIMAWPWFLVIVLLTAAYYGFYYVSFKADQESSASSWVFSLSVLLVFLVGFIYSNTHTLSVTPTAWASKYFADPGGWNLNLGDSTLIPRFLHFFVAALALGGLFVAFIGLYRWKKEPDYAKFLIRIGGKWFMYVTMVQFVVGIWFLISQPRTQMMLFMGDNLLATIALVIGIVAGLAAIFLMSDALRKDDPRRGVYLVSGSTALVIIFMSTMRDILRDSYLGQHFNSAQFASVTQWTVLPLFLVLFVGGVILWLVMLKRYNFSGTAIQE